MDTPATGAPRGQRCQWVRVRAMGLKWGGGATRRRRRREQSREREMAKATRGKKCAAAPTGLTVERAARRIAAAATFQAVRSARASAELECLRVLWGDGNPAEAL